NPEETARISIQVPKKGEDAAVGDDGVDALLGPAKKKRVTRSTTGCSLLQGGAPRTLLPGTMSWPKNLQRWLLRTLTSPVLFA
ncbi:hypothetical protein A2U01_0080469, partial [Trifolium medium]|nr:hypothetical protein [Trifolium medium]